MPHAKYDVVYTVAWYSSKRWLYSAVKLKFSWHICSNTISSGCPHRGRNCITASQGKAAVLNFYYWQLGGRAQPLSIRPCRLLQQVG